MPILAGPSGAPIVTVVASSLASAKPGASVFSTATGSRPVPFLPVDSAISCSAQSGNPAMPEPLSASTTFSAPLLCAVPSAAASTSAGLSGESTASCVAAAAASSSRAATSAPASPAGTRPNAVSAE